jgi:putative PIN family toxin of toxin-antitoxin system
MTPVDIDKLEKVVFDCNIFASALINIRGPAGQCLEIVQKGYLTLFVSDYLLQEIRELPSKIPLKYGVTAERVEQFIEDLSKYARAITNVPSVYVHPLDPDDSHYVDLAVATSAKLIVSRDKHLRKLMDERTKDGKEFHEKFPSLNIILPDVLLERLGVTGKGKGG